MDGVPDGSWFCPDCEPTASISDDDDDDDELDEDDVEPATYGVLHGDNVRVRRQRQPAPRRRKSAVGRYLVHVTRAASNTRQTGSGTGYRSQHHAALDAGPSDPAVAD